jgi:hypothetical protein
LPKGAQDALLEERQYGMVSYQFSWRSAPDFK